MYLTGDKKMKIYEVTGQIKKVTGNEVEIEDPNKPGVTTKIDISKNPQAVQKDPSTGTVKVNTAAKDKAQNTKAAIKPGDKVEMPANQMKESDVGAVQKKFMGRVKQAAQKVPGGDANQVPGKLKNQIAQLVQDASGSAAAAMAGSDEVQGGPAITKRMAQAEKQLFDMINQADPQMKAHLVAAVSNAIAVGAKPSAAPAKLSKQAPGAM